MLVNINKHFSTAQTWLAEGNSSLSAQSKALIPSSPSVGSYKEAHALKKDYIYGGALRPPRNFPCDHTVTKPLEKWFRNLGDCLSPLNEGFSDTNEDELKWTMQRPSPPLFSSTLTTESVRDRANFYREYLKFHITPTRLLDQNVSKKWSFIYFSDVDIKHSGHYVRSKISSPIAAACFKKWLEATIGATRSEEQAIKKLQRAREIYRPQKFRPYFEAPVLAPFRGLHGGNGEAYEAARKNLEYLVNGHRFGIDYLLESLSEPGFYDKVYRNSDKKTFGWASVTNLFHQGKALFGAFAGTVCAAGHNIYLFGSSFMARYGTASFMPKRAESELQ